MGLDPASASGLHPKFHAIYTAPSEAYIAVCHAGLGAQDVVPTAWPSPKVQAPKKEKDSDYSQSLPKMICCEGSIRHGREGEHMPCSALNGKGIINTAQDSRSPVILVAAAAAVAGGGDVRRRHEAQQQHRDRGRRRGLVFRGMRSREERHLNHLLFLTQD